MLLRSIQNDGGLGLVMTMVRPFRRAGGLGFDGFVLLAEVVDDGGVG